MKSYSDKMFYGSGLNYLHINNKENYYGFHEKTMEGFRL